MDAVTVLAEIERLGGDVRPEGDLLRVITPPGGIPPDLRRALMELKPAIVRLLTHGREIPFEEVWRLDRTTDPRPDLKEDSRQWGRLLTRAHDTPVVDHELFGALDYIRCLGAHLERAGAAWRIHRGECPADEYDHVRSRMFVPHEDIMRELLRHDDA
jgi:hypothetical protein